MIARRLLLLFTAIHAIANAARVTEAITLAPALPVNSDSYALIVGVFGALWAAIFAALCAGIWAQRKHIGRVTIYAAVIYQISVIILLQTGAQSSEAPQRIGFAALWATTAVALTCLLVWLWRGRQR
jgi:hypothetical protein